MRPKQSMVWKLLLQCRCTCSCGVGLLKAHVIKLLHHPFHLIYATVHFDAILCEKSTRVPSAPCHVAGKRSRLDGCITCGVRNPIYIDMKCARINITAIMNYCFTCKVASVTCDTVCLRQIDVAVLVPGWYATGNTWHT